MIRLIAINLLVGAGLAILSATSAGAQAVNNADALKDFKTESTDPFSNRSGDNYGGVFDLIHRVMQGTPDAAAFESQQDQNLDDAAIAFKAMQRQRLAQPAPAQATPTAPMTPQ